MLPFVETCFQYGSLHFNIEMYDTFVGKDDSTVTPSAQLRDLSSTPLGIFMSIINTSLGCCAIAVCD